MIRNIGIIALVFTVTLFLSSCGESANKKTKIKVEENVSIENFDWLLGNWKRNFEEQGKQTFEIWKKNSSSEYSGIGFTMQNNDTLKKEKIRLIKTNKKWVLEVQPQDEPTPIVFIMTSYSDQEFVCENRTLDFPKLIKYWKDGNKIKALVSGDDMEIPFEFERTGQNK